MDGGAGNRQAGQASRQRVALAALDSMPGTNDRAAWVRRWQGAHGLTVDGLPGRLAAQVRLLRAAIRLAEGTIRQAAERGQG